ncbi:MAG: hypothetical protein DME25_17530 [Verrucomicrobia bacterium]|nr:MAG: hypothetical protein DME25_17530 [Verrucomicrobiota bacterium]
MNPKTLLRTSIQALITGCAIVMSALAGEPWPAMVGLGILGANAIAAQVTAGKRRGRIWAWATILAWVCTWVVPARLVLQTDRGFSYQGFVNSYLAVLAWLAATATLLDRHCFGVVSAKVRWKIPAVICASFAGWLWLGSAYWENARPAFYVGLAVNVSLLLLWQIWFRLPAWGTISLNTLMFFLLGLPMADVLAPPRLASRAATGKRYYSYAAAKKDPAAFAQWWNYFVEQWIVMSKELYAPERFRKPGYHLRPGSHSHLFESFISINRLGFRGREISEEKGGAYRIVCLGESTTFGCTLGPEDRPWPELLEQMIRERLKPNRPVEVVNAGVPGYTLADNLDRLTKEILRLTPDMIISYHGYNGFPLLDVSLTPPERVNLPVYAQRPVKVLADAEYHLKILHFRKRLASDGTPRLPGLADATKTPYAAAYRQLAQLAKAKGVRLVVGNFSMAANTQSDPDVIEFYRPGFPLVRSQVKANVLHSRIVEELAKQNPEICLVETQPHLDGDHEKFVDLVHLTQEGRQQLAESFFAGIRKVLEGDLSQAESARAER